MALRGHYGRAYECPLLGVKQTWLFALHSFVRVVANSAIIDAAQTEPWHARGRRSTRRPKAQMLPRKKAVVDPLRSQNGGHFVLSWAVLPPGMCPFYPFVKTPPYCP